MITIRTNFYWKIKISANKQEEELSKSGKKELTFTSTINISTHTSSPPGLTFLVSPEPKPQEPRLDDGGALAGLQIREKKP